MLKPAWRCKVAWFVVVCSLGVGVLPAWGGIDLARPITLEGEIGKPAWLKLSEQRPALGLEVYRIPEGVKEVTLTPLELSPKRDVAVLQSYKNRYRMFWFLTMTWLVVGFGQRGR